MEESDLKLSKADRSNLLETAKWGKFLGIVGFVMSGFIVLGGITMFGGAFNTVYPGLGSGIGFIYILASLLYIFPSLYTYKFSTKIKFGLQKDDPEACSEGYNNLRKLFVFMGIMTIIVLSLYALMIVFMLMGGMMGSML